MRVKADWPMRIWRDTVSTNNSALQDIDRCADSISRQLLGPTATELGTYIVDTSFLSVYTARIAVHQFDRNEHATGWRLITECMVYALTSYKISYAIRFPNGTPLFSNKCSLLLCTALALKSRHVAEWTAKFIVEVEANPKSKLREAKPDDFQCLAYLFAAEVTGSKVKHEWREKLDAGLYGPLLQSESLEEAQAALPDLAIARGALVSESFMDYPPFEWPPFDLFPVDILAILLMRHTDMADFDFGCLESPLCHPPATLNWEKNDLIKRVEARVQSLLEYPNVDWE